MDKIRKSNQAAFYVHKFMVKLKNIVKKEYKTQSSKDKKIPTNALEKINLYENCKIVVASLQS